jgi:inner membrane protease ATP23
MQMSDAIAHELIHHYDYERGIMHDVEEPSIDSCKNLAYSEIRAASLSGDCKFTRELLRGNMFPVSKHLQVKCSFILIVDLR